MTAKSPTLRAKSVYTRSSQHVVDVSVESSAGFCVVEGDAVGKDDDDDDDDDDSVVA